MNAPDMPVAGATADAGLSLGASEGDSLTGPILRPQIAYCGNCGHDQPRHRNGRCWTDALGNPLARTRSLIACMCDRFEAAS